MKFKNIKRAAHFLSKDYADDIFRLLMDYKDISASEAASRLDLHIKTVQDFFEALSEAEILNQEEVNEGKRPYNRYSLKSNTFSLDFDIEELKSENKTEDDIKIREAKDAGVRFNISRDSKTFSSVVIWLGKGRTRKERKINLTSAQGKFLYNLPFPTANFKSIDEIIKQAEIKVSYKKEIVDIVQVLIDFKVIDVK